MENINLRAKFAGFKGYALAVIAAAAYGTNPAFAVPLYDEGMNPSSVLLFRYMMGLPLLLLLARFRHVSMRLSFWQAPIVIVLGVLMALSSLTLFESYLYMNSGIASTLLFVYPVMVALIMIFFFKEKFKVNIAVCLVVMGVGLTVMMRPGGGDVLSGKGIGLVMISALTYALYMVLINVVKRVKNIPTTALLFYLLASGCIVFVMKIMSGDGLTMPSKPTAWLNLSCLTLIPTIISLACTTRAIQLIGSTPTAILGALEPVAAVILSVVVLGQALTARDVIGGGLVVLATTMVVGDKTVDGVILRLRKMWPKNKKRAHRE